MAYGCLVQKGEMLSSLSRLSCLLQKYIWVCAWKALSQYNIGKDNDSALYALEKSFQQHTLFLTLWKPHCDCAIHEHSHNIGASSPKENDPHHPTDGIKICNKLHKSIFKNNKNSMTSDEGENPISLWHFGSY